MNREILHSSWAEDPVAPYSQMVGYGDLIFVSGQVAEEARGDPARQTQLILERIGHMLREVGSGPEKILKCMVHLSDGSHFEEMNRAYGAYFQGEYPARICTSGVQLWGGLEVEIEAIAGK